MNWAHFYLGCFAVGFVFSVLAFLSGALRVHLHVHLPHWDHAGVGQVGHAPVAAHAPAVGGHGTPALAQGTESAGQTAQHASQLSPFNLATLAAFLAWFGGSGYLLTRYSSLWFALGLLIASGAGLAGAGIVFTFISKVLMSEEAHMDAADYEMVGVLGRISSPVREGGTGELIYSQAGTRRSCGVRSEDGSVLDKGTEVVVTRYEKGIAYVRRWVEMAGEE